MAPNKRMALAGHLDAAQSGMALMIFGLILPMLSLSEELSAVAYLSSIWGYYLIWVGITIESFTGASKAQPMAGAGFSGSVLAERTVYVLEAGGVVLSLISGVQIIVGLTSV
ncbi:MAG: hydroxylaminobenzene mutase [Planctomycetaceae bacterium]